jgi:hypothetical protein
MNTLQTLKYLFRFVLSNRRKKYGSVFEGEEIFSSNYQDFALLRLLKQKTNGWYVEVGAQDPIKRNNNEPFCTPRVMCCSPKMPHRTAIPWKIGG